MPVDGAVAAGADFRVWDGVYRSFAEAPAQGPGFDGEEWHARSLAAAKAARGALEGGRALDVSLTQRNAMLAPLIATLLAAQPRVSVLDFGGGPGLGFIALSQALSEAMSLVDYAIVDGAGVCDAGCALFGAAGPSFYKRMPEDLAFDIVHAASVVQYIEDWEGGIATLASSGAAFLSFGDIFAGGFQPYVSLQNYYGSRIRHWFFNLDTFVAAVERHGYRLTRRAPCHVEVLGRRGPLPMDNLPAELRMAHTHHLVFARADVAA